MRRTKGNKRGIRGKPYRIRVLKLHMKKNYQLYLMVLPAFLLVLLFNYIPMYGLQLAFREFSPIKGWC